MPGFFIKWEKGLEIKSEVMQMAAALSVTRFDICGRLMTVWAWADEVIGEKDYDEDGNAFVPLSSRHFPLIDEIAGLPMFASTMSDAGWLKDRGTRLMLPNFGRHNGKTAKTRMLETEKKRRQRHQSGAKAVPIVSPQKRDSSVSVSDSVSHSGKGRVQRGEPPGFVVFWEARPRAPDGSNHPRWTARAKALAKWLSLGLESRAPEVIRSLEAWKVSHEWTRDGGAYLAGVEPWLNGQKYETCPPPAGAVVLPMRNETAAERRRREIADILSEKRSA